MKRLRELREKARYSQQQLAEMLDTTQQTIARWESGKAEPNLAALRDLAICLHTTVDSLLGRTPVLPSQTTNPFAWIDGDESGFWGHIGIRLPQAPFTRWYPVSTRTMKEVYRDVQCDDPDEWITFQTLNNKMVIFAPTQSLWVIFLDEADDGLDGDWQLEADAFEGWPEEIYNCIEARFDYSGDDKDPQKFSKKIVAATDELMQTHAIDEEKATRLCSESRVIFRDGAERQFVCSPENMANAFFDFDIGIKLAGTLMLRLDDDYGARDFFISVSRMALMELPLVKLKEGLEQDLPELEAAEKTAYAVAKKTKKKTD